MLRDYEKLKQVIHDANPEILDLTPARGTVDKILTNLNDRSGVSLDFDDDIQREMEDELAAIIGRPIRLADVVLRVEEWERHFHRSPHQRNETILDLLDT